MVRRLQGQTGEHLIIALAHVAIDAQEALEQIARALRINLADYFLQEGIVNHQIARMEFLGKDFVPETGGSLRARGITDENFGIHTLPQVPRGSEYGETLARRPAL